MLIYGHDDQIAQWVCGQLKLKPYPQGMYRAIGITNSHGKLIGGLIWHNYHEDNWGKPMFIEVTLATVDKHWATRHTLRELFQYPFTQLKVRRVQATCHRKAKRVRTALVKLGFQLEGIVRDAHPQGGDAAHYSILRNECKWLKGNNNGEECAKSTASTKSNGYGQCANSQQSANGAL